MTKQDIKEDLPEQVPRKKRHIETLDAVHLAMYLAQDDLSPGDRKRLEAEKERRKSLQTEKTVGLLVGNEGMTPLQLEKLKELLTNSGCTEIRHSGVASRVHQVCKSIASVVYLDDGNNRQLYPQEVIKTSDHIYAMPKDPETKAYSSGGVWQDVGHARHRNVPVTVIMPDGRVEV